MKLKFNFIFLFLAFGIFVLSLLLYNNFESAKYKIYKKIFNHLYFNIEDVSSNYQKFLLEFMPKNGNWYLYLKHHSKLRHSLNNSLQLISSRYIKYIYLLQRGKNGKFIFLADGSREDRASFGETFIPLRVEEYNKLRPHFFYHTRLKSIWLTYIYPVKKDVFLVIDVPLTLFNYIQSILENLTQNIKAILTFIFFMIMLLVVFSYFDRRREMEKEKLLKELQSTNEALELKVKEKVEEIRKKDILLLNQSKLASLGEMLNMIAHQWRQPLNAISAYAVKIELEANFKEIPKEEVIEFSKYVQYQAQTMSNIINDFMNFAKPAEKEEFYLKEAVDEVLKMVKGQLEANKIEIETDIQNIKLVSYKKEIIHILLNLIANAKDILIERDVKDKKIKIYNEGNKIVVEDNGGGIEGAIKEKIFDPYFTTKFEGKGTGLGLYMSKKIAIEKLDGDLYFENGEEGAKFILIIGK